MCKSDFVVTIEVTIEAVDSRDAKQFAYDLIAEMDNGMDGDQYQKFIDATVIDVQAQ